MSTDSRTVSTHYSDYTTASCTVITADRKITKTYAKRDGVVCKTVAAQFSKATAQRVTFASATDFAAMINCLTTNQALMHGVYERDITDVYSKERFDRLDDQTHAATRTKTHTAWPAGGGVLVLDYDAPDADQALQLDQLRSIIGSMLPLDTAAYVTAFSSSSFIYDGKQQYSGSKGLRIYILVKDAQDIPRAGKVLFDRLWLAGYGFFVISKSGGLLNRSIVDASVWQPSRLDFASGADCVAPITQQRPPAAAYDGAFLDTQTALPDLSEHEQQQLDAMFTAERTRLKPQAERIRGAYIEDRAKQQLDREGVNNANPERLAAVKQSIAKSLDGGVLHADWLVMLADRSLVTVADIYADRAKYHGVTCKDPIEHDYNDYHTCAIIYTDRDSVTIISQAHGQRKYTCRDFIPDNLPDFSLSELKKKQIQEPALDLKALLKNADGSDNERCAVLAYSYALRMASSIPLTLTLNRLKRNVTEHADGKVGTTTLAAILDHVAVVVAMRARAALKQITVSQSVKKRHNYRQISALTDIDTTAITHGVHAAQAQTGKGKTQQFLQPIVARFKQAGQQVAVIAPARTLVAELSHRLGLTHYDDIKLENSEMRKAGYGDMTGHIDHLATCINSIGAQCFELFFSDLKCVVIDEVTQALAAFASDTSFVGGKAHCFDLLKQIIKNAELVLVADANLTDSTIAFLESCRPSERFFLYDLPPADEGKTVVWHADKIALINQIVEDVLLCEKRVYVACDTAKEARRVHKMLTDVYDGIQVKLVTGDTKDADDLAFLSDVDRYSLDYDVVVTSPKIKSGISIEHQAAIGQRFDYVVGIFLGTTITSSDAYQMLGRVRYAKTLHIFTDTSRKAHDIDSDDDVTARDALSSMAGSQDRSTRLTRHMADIRNAYAKNISNFAANLYYTLKHYRHEMLRSEYQASVHQENLYKRVKDELNSDDMQRMLAARWLTDDEADAMRREPCLTEDQVWQLKAHDKRKYLNLPADALLTEGMLGVNMAQIKRFATIMQLPLDDLDDSDKDLSERRFSTAMRRIVAELSDTLRIVPNAIYAEAQANAALDAIDPYRVKLGVAGFIPSRFATRYYQRGKSSVKDLNEILDHWGLDRLRTRNPTTGKFYMGGEVSILHRDDLRSATDEKVCRLKPDCFDAMHSMYEMHLSPERDFSLIQRCIENDQIWDTSGVFSKKLDAMCPKKDQKTINSMVIMDTQHATQHAQPQPLADQALIEGIIGHTFDKIGKRVKQLPKYAGLSSDQSLVAGVADMLQWKAEQNYSLTERIYSVLDSEILLYADDEGAILYKITSAIGSHSPEDVFTIFDSLPPITKSLDLNRDSTKPANTDLPDAI